MELLELPPHVLLEVLVRLPTRDLLVLRGTCRRLRDLALDQHLWGRRALLPAAEGARLSAAVLRLAPSLADLRLTDDCFNAEATGDLGIVTTATHCAAEQLRLEMDYCAYCHWLRAALVIRNQESLRRLRKLTVVLKTWPTCYNEREEIGYLLQTLLGVHGLTELTIELQGMDSVQHPIVNSPDACRTPASLWPSVRKLSLRSLPAGAPQVETLLRLHGPALEEVDLGMRPVFEGAAAVLATLPRLRRLSCAVLPDMRPLQRCGTLAALRLVVAGAAARGATTLLRNAVQLQEVSIVSHDGSAPVGELLLALSSSGRSQVRWLSVDVIIRDVTEGARDDPAGGVQPLLPLSSVLPRLPHLRDLSVETGVEAEDVLAALLAAGPGGAPLCRLYLRNVTQWGPVPPGGSCSHAFMHSQVLQEVLSALPQLHVVTDRVTCWWPDSLCEHCAAGCHALPALRAEERVGLYAHPEGKGEGDDCGLRHGLRDEDVERRHWPITWLRIPAAANLK